MHCARETFPVSAIISLIFGISRENKVETGQLLVQSPYHFFSVLVCPKNTLDPSFAFLANFFWTVEKNFQIEVVEHKFKKIFGRFVFK